MGLHATSKVGHIGLDVLSNADKEGSQVGGSELAGLQTMGLEAVAQEGHRLPSLDAVRVPEGVGDARVRSRLLHEYSIEIGGGLGALKGQIWRLGLMGYNSRRNTVFTFIGALEAVLHAEGFSLEPGAALGAAREVYD